MPIADQLNRLKQRYSQSNTEALRNPWVLGWLGLVAVFVAVNGLFVVLSITTNPGLVVKDYYEQGRVFEKNALRMLAARNALHWETKLETPERIQAHRPGVYRFSGVDERGIPLSGAEVKLTAYRPSDAGADFVTRLDPIGPGLYGNVLELPLPGIWDLHIHARLGDDDFQQSYRINALVP